MVIEACEYRNAFLNYIPDIAIITNIDPDHLDFFKTDTAYYAAFERFMASARCVVILGEKFHNFQEKIQNTKYKIQNEKSEPNSPLDFHQKIRGGGTMGIQLGVSKNTDTHSQDSQNGGTPPTPSQARGSQNQTLVLVHTDRFEVIGNDFGALVAGTYTYSLPELLVPGGHIRLDASLAYVTSQLL